MNDFKKKEIIKIITKREKLRSLNRIKRLVVDPIRALPFYFLAAASHIKPFEITFDTLWGTKMTSYLPEGNTFYYYGFCEANLTNFLLRFLKHSDTFVDVGAHIGFYSMLASEIVGENGKIYSFEPTPRTFKTLKENTKKLKNVHLFNIALSNKEGRIDFSDYGPGYGAYNSGHPNGAALLNKKPRKITVETKTLDSILKLENISPNIIKLDAEGLEYKILQGMSNTLSKTNRPIITLEVAGDRQWKNNYDNSIKLLLENDYKVFEINTVGLIKPHKIKQIYKYDNILFIPTEKTNALKYLYANN